ncbi:hypothetical protein OG320_06650 [Microbispora sp. NBC_01189]|uniref:hypothetical protein n=1 Tax=Microbispora sp. NBC_01189 TaxID=2903583 RepID=UPI002E12D3C2|nr:hypothetical protein OG320_06650 [Microbispora sp. NBC_01189]
MGEPGDPEPGTRTFAALSPESLASHDDDPPRGFLGSGWNDRPEPPKRLRRVALVSGLSVLLAVGVTTGGVRLMAGRTTLTAEPARQACASAVDCAVTGAPSLGAGAPQETGPAPQIGDAAGDAAGDAEGGTTGGTAGDGAAGDGAAGDTAGDGAAGGRTGEDPARGDTGPGTPPGPGSLPVSDPAGPGADPGRTEEKARASASPKARATSPAGHRSGSRTGAGSTPAGVGAPATADAPGTDGTTAGTTDGADPDSTAAPGTSEPGGAGAGSPDSGGEAPHTDSAAAPGDGAVRVTYAATGRRGAAYTARLAVRNEGPALSSWTLRLPVGGRVIAVRGAAHWEQQGDTLVVTGESFGEGGEIGVVFDAEGSSRAPAECALAEGTCAVASDSRHHR